MKKILLLAACLVSLPLYAAEITCYDHGLKTYHGHGHRIEYGDDYLVFTEDPSERLTFIFGNCIIQVKTKGHHNAIKKGR